MDEHRFALNEAYDRLKRDPENERAWSQFLERASTLLLFRLYKLSAGHKELCQDVLQDVWLKFFTSNSLRRLKNGDEAVAFLQVMARNRLIDHIRSANATAKSTSVGELDTASGVYSGGHPAKATIVSHSDLERLSRQLPDKDWEVLECVLRGEGDVSSVAQALQISYGNAAVRLHRLRQRLTRLAELGLKRTQYVK